MTFASLTRPVRSARPAAPRPKPQASRTSVDSIVGRTLGIGDESSHAEHRAREAEQPNEVAQSSAIQDVRPAPRHEQAELVSATATAALGLSRGRRISADLSVRLSERIGAIPNDLIVHDSESDGEVANALNARAFAMGNHLVFGRNEYRPQTSNGFSLIAHEAYHAAYPNPRGTGLIQRSKKDVPSAVRRGEPITQDDVQAVYDAGSEDWFALRMAMTMIVQDRAQPPEVQKIANDVLRFMDYLDAVELRNEADSTLMNPLAGDLDEPDALTTIRNYETQDSFVDSNLGAGELTPWEELLYWRNPMLPLPTPPAPSMEEEAEEQPLRYPADDNALLAAMSEAELDELIAQHRERRESSDPKTAEKIDTIITELEQLKIIVARMQLTMTEIPGKVALTQHIPLLVEVPPVLAEQYGTSDMLPTSELVQHRFGIVALDRSAMTVVYVAAPDDIDTWIVFKYDVGTGKILSEMSVDAYREQEKLKARGEPGIQATLSPIDYLIFGAFAGPAMFRQVVMSQWAGVLTPELVKAKAISSGVNVLAQGSADYLFTGELDYSNLGAAAFFGYLGGGLQPGLIGELQSGSIGMAGAGAADLMNYAQSQSEDPVNLLNLGLGFGSNMLGHRLQTPARSGGVSFGAASYSLYASRDKTPQVDLLSRTKVSAPWIAMLEGSSSTGQTLSVSLSPTTLILDPTMGIHPLFTGQPTPGVSGFASTPDPNVVVEQLNALGRPELRVTSNLSDEKQSAPMPEPRDVVEQLNALGRSELRVTAKPSSEEQSPASSANAESTSEGVRIKVCTDAIIVDGTEAKLACGSELVDLSDIRFGIDTAR